MKKNLFVLLSLLIATLLLAACGGGAPAPLDVTLVGKDDFTFTPGTINAKPGQTVNLTYKNEGVLEHSIVIEAVSVNLKVQAGQSANISFTAPAAGEYEFHCDIAGHKEGGMTGKLMVAP